MGKTRLTPFGRLLTIGDVTQLIRASHQGATELVEITDPNGSFRLKIVTRPHFSQPLQSNQPTAQRVITSPDDGYVTFCVSIGDEVKRGDLVAEIMVMGMGIIEIQATSDGTVCQLLPKNNSRVATGQGLLTMQLSSSTKRKRQCK